MGSSSLKGRKARILANDIIYLDLMAHITCIDEFDRKILLQLDSPVMISGNTFTYAVISPRLDKNNLSDLLKSGTLGCSVTWVPKDLFDPVKPFNLSWWRGGAAAITDVVLD